MTFRRFATALFLLALFTATAHAGFIPAAAAPWETVHTGEVIGFSRGSGSGPGGEFIVYNTVPSSNKPYSLIKDKSLFDTFCLEKNEYLSFSGNFVVGGLSRAARNGGLGGQDSSGVADPLDPRTAYLYQQFYDQRLSNYQYENGDLRGASADQLQNAIWFLENELTGKSPTGKSLGYAYDPTDMGIAAKTLGNDSQAYHWVFEADEAVRGGTHIGDHVRVINLLDSQGGRAQDLLAVGTPEPSSLVVWGVLFGMVTYWAWRRRAARSRRAAC
jgi:hypothetical protein